MKVKALQLLKYGPLENILLNFREGFNLIYGKNEEGKTLTLEALTRLLLGKNAKKILRKAKEFKRIDAIPEGLAIINLNGKEIILDGRRDLFSHLPYQVEAMDLTNIFIIRNSDLLIKEENYYSKISERLSNIEISKIEEIKKLVELKGNVTPGQRNLSSAGEKKAGERLERAKELIERIDNFTKNLNEKGIEYDGKKLTENYLKLRRLSEHKKLLEEAKKASLANQAKSLLKRISQSQLELEEWENINDSDLIEFDKLENEEERINDQITKLKEDEKEKRENIIKIEDEIESSQSKLQKLRNELELLNNYRKEAEDILYEPLPEEYYAHNLLKKLPIPILIVITIMSFFYFYSGKNIFLIFLTLLITAFITNFIYIILIENKGKKVLIRQKKLETETGYKAKEILKQIEQLNDSIREIEMNLVTKKEILNEKQKDLRKIKETLRKSEQYKNEISKKLNFYRKETKAVSANELRIKLERKKEILHNLDKTTVEAKEMLKQYYDKVPDSIEDIQSILVNLSQYTQASDIKYSPKEYDEILKKIELTQNEIEHLSNSINLTKNELLLISSEASKIIGKEIIIETPELLPLLKEELKHLIYSIEDEYKMALTILKILDEIENEEINMVETIFKQQNISSIFAELTENRYTEVRLNNKEIEVKTKDGIILKPFQLSGATFDQLYFSIRIAIGKAILQSPGFLILDDPFIKYDRERLITQFKMLKILTEENWQVIYFTAKDEVVEVTENIFGEKENLLIFNKFH